MKTLPLLLILFSTALAIGQEKKICISIDDVPAVKYNSKNRNLDKEITLKLIKTFKEYSIPAIGFVNEKKLYKKGKLDSTKLELLHLWLKNGCDLGNHTYSHFDYNNVPESDYFKDIIDGQEVTKPLLNEYGKTIKYFRHPYLHTGSDSLKAIKLQEFLSENGYTSCPVTIDNDDYLFAKAYHIALTKNDNSMAATIAENYIDYMEKILLLFERKSTEVFGKNIAQSLLIHASLLNADYLDELAMLYKKHGYTFVSQEEVLNQKEYATEINTYSSRGLSWIYRRGMSLGKGDDIMSESIDVPDAIIQYAKE
ncbi:polysaccharide deacetylase family protein [Arcticibacterium luteifluviistationis]|nr:polysaccharide deacetylase family protein [Arcticibacterium luteifluviistationis]